MEFKIGSYVEDIASGETGRVKKSGWTAPEDRPVRVYLYESNAYVWRAPEELKPLHCECPLNGEPCHTCGLNCSAPALEADAHERVTRATSQY